MPNLKYKNIWRAQQIGLTVQHNLLKTTHADLARELQDVQGNEYLQVRLHV